MNIFITGISGTLGTAFAEYLDKHNHSVSGIDRNEEGVAKFKAKHPNILVYTGDFSDFDLSNRGINLVIHLAAMKHIDLCEQNTNACVMNNIIKTYFLFNNARNNNIDILFMSTDKAVEPGSMYGYSKALAEGMVKELGGTFIRSGNILASNGSVMKIWDDAIENNEPIKVTHKDMRRYFITPENLVERAWEQYGENKVIIPKMDREVKLLDLVKEKLAAHGYTIETYKPGIEYIGLRPGEKLREKLQ